MVQRRRNEGNSLNGNYNFTDLAQMVCKVRRNNGVTTDEGS
jgi:hypothetical protein